MFTVKIDGQDQNISDAATLAAMLKGGQVQSDTPVYDHGTGEWRTVDSIVTPPAPVAPQPAATPAPTQTVAVVPLQSYKGTIILRHPTTGDQKKLTVHTAGTFMILFGPFYLMYHRVWLHGFLSLGISLFAPGAWIIWCFFAKKLIANRYLKAGYEVIAHYPDGKEPKQVN